MTNLYESPPVPEQEIEKLKLAAKACGLDTARYDEKSGCMVHPFRSPLTDGHLWHPGADAGDAFRAAIHLRLFESAAFMGDVLIPALHSENPTEAACQGILNALAEIGLMASRPGE